MSLKIIPIFFTFNNDYVVPAAVAFYSLLNKAKEGVFYEMYVLHSDITPENQDLLQSIVGRFKPFSTLGMNGKKGILKEIISRQNLPRML